MKVLSTTSFIAVLGLATSALAQTPAPQTQKPTTSDPSAASSPHQRESTRTGTAEAPATGSPEAAGASSPHQREATNTAGGTGTKMANRGEGATAEPETPKTFVSKAAQDGMTEVELGKLAATKAQSPEVKKFADRMVKDHGKANMELETIAKAKSLQVPKKLDAEHQSMVDELSGKSGAEFDASYSQHMAAAHGKAVALFESGSRLSDAELAAFAKKTLPTLKEHKQMADSLKMGTRAADAGGATSTR
jgi:putative membrane protein